MVYDLINKLIKLFYIKYLKTNKNNIIIIF